MCRVGAPGYSWFDVPGNADFHIQLVAETEWQIQKEFHFIGDASVFTGGLTPRGQLEVHKDIRCQVSHLYGSVVV